MFIFGGLPALFIAFIRYSDTESAKWHERFGENVRARPKMRESFAAIFSPTYRRRTLVMSGLFLTSIIGLWAGSIYVPTAVSQIATRAGSSAADAARLASSRRDGAVDRHHRRMHRGAVHRRTPRPAPGDGNLLRDDGDQHCRHVRLRVLPAGIGVQLAVRRHPVPGDRRRELRDVQTLWLPERSDTACRASAIAFISSIGRFVGVAMVFILADGIRSYGSLGVPVAVTALAFVFGLLILPLTEETRGKALPA